MAQEVETVQLSEIVCLLRKEAAKVEAYLAKKMEDGAAMSDDLRGWIVLHCELMGAIAKITRACENKGGGNFDNRLRDGEA